MELKEALEKRRSVRKFTERAVTDEEIGMILRAARIAPSWANVQPWEIVVVRDRELISAIAGTYVEKNPAAKCTLASSAVLVVCGKKLASGYYDGKPTTKHGDWLMFDLGLAVQNICLRAHDLGLGSVVVGLFDHDACAKLLELPDGYEVAVVIPLGEPAVAGKEGPPRKELSAFVHDGKFGVPYTLQG
ncbi:MAG TPA: nitroreductase [Spirochaetes bacterium]|nr:nitroreductase [Spirochaetota bacterium]